MLHAWILAIAVISSTCIAQPRDDRPLTEGLHSAVLPLFAALEGNKLGSMGIVGDSVSLLDSSYNWQLRNHFWDDYGIGGDGYLGLARFNAHCAHGDRGPRCGLHFEPGPGCVLSEDTGPFGELGQYTPDGMWIELQTGSEPGSGVANVLGRKISVFYTKRVGGGTATVRLNGSQIGKIHTSLASGEPRTGEFSVDTGVSDPDDVSALTFTLHGASPVQIDGIEMLSGTPGFVYHRLARGGVGPGRFLASTTPATASLLRGLDMQLLIIMLDSAAGDGHGTDGIWYERNLSELLDFYMASMPDTKIILMTHYPFSPSAEPQADAMLRVARDRGLGYINLYDLFSGYDEMYELGLIHGNVHLTEAGGVWFGNYIYGVLTQAAQEALIADQNGDGVFDIYDMLAFLNAYSTGQADVNQDGVDDFYDLQDFLSCYQASAND